MDAGFGWGWKRCMDNSSIPAVRGMTILCWRKSVSCRASEVLYKIPTAKSPRHAGHAMLATNTALEIRHQ